MFPGFVTIYKDKENHVHLYFFPGIDENDNPSVLASYSNRITEDYNLRIAQDSSFRIIEL